MATAFEAVTSRQSWYAAAVIPKYYGVQFDTNGKFVKADGSRPFAGIVQYGSEAAGDMITVVKGDFPAIAQEAITAGNLVTIATGDDAGTFKVADTALDVVYGVALTGADAGELFTISLIPVPKTIPQP
jgi:hypothetical protein